MIFFATLFLALVNASQAQTEFELTDCEESGDLCFDVENGDEMDTLVLFALGGNNFEGFMEETNSPAFASSQNGENFEVRFSIYECLYSKVKGNIPHSLSQNISRYMLNTLLSFQFLFT